MRQGMCDQFALPSRLREGSGEGLTVASSRFFHVRPSPSPSRKREGNGG